MKHLKPFLSLLLAAVMVFSAGVIPVSAADDGTLVVSSATGKAGEEVVISINATSNPGVTQMNLKVAYDSALKLIKAEDQGILGNANHSPTYTKNPYALSWDNGTARENFTSTGTLVKLTFEMPVTVWQRQTTSP